jgi:hypothetical protein
MKIKEIVKLEEDNHDKCYLIKEGLFWRAYEKSAFWFVDKLRSYMITKKHFKGLNADVAYIGFPDTEKAANNRPQPYSSVGGGNPDRVHTRRKNRSSFFIHLKFKVMKHIFTFYDSS